jgi:hypothetical protein
MSATFNSLRVSIAEQFKESVSEPSPNTKVYLTYGKSLPWSNEDQPNTANSSVSTEYEIWDNMIGAKKITGSDMRHVIPRYNWTLNTDYTAYSDTDTDLYNSNTKFYVVTSQNHIFKCLSNNSSSNSTVEPSALNFNTATTIVQDGYVWKYMYSLTDQDLLRFTTSDYIPVKTLNSNDGSTQWTVQQAAIEGGIYAAPIISGGSGYTNTSNIVVLISGDGSSAIATASINLSSNTVSNLTITNPGSGYTYASVTISGGGGSGANAKPVISPPGGHGSNPLYELGGNIVMINGRLINSEGSTLPIDHTYRQVGLVIDPKKFNSTEISANGVINQTYQITTIGSGTYTVGEYVYQGSSFDASTFSGVIIEDDNGTVKISNYRGTPTVGTLVGVSSGVVRYTTSDIITPELTKYSGKVAYIDNIRPITRDADQTEEYRIAIRF